MRTVKLPKRKVHKTPRLLVADAYTIGSNPFESEDAKNKSTYYITFRKKLSTVNPDLYDKGNDKMIFGGLQRILDKLFYEPITHAEIDAAKEFLKNAKVSSTGYREFHLPEEMWRTVVDKYNGRPPIEIFAMPEGSVVYPNEPIVQVTSKSLDKEQMGVLGAWFESKLLHVWAVSERITQNQHWFQYLLETFKKINPELTNAEAEFFASIMLHDFGDRAGITAEESEELGMAHLYTFPGTDTFAGAYQAYMNCEGKDTTGLFGSVNALAHRNVQSYEFEGDCYTAIYDASANGEFISMVADCYDYKFAVENYLLPLAKRSIVENNGKIVVARPDSGDALEQILWTINLAVEHGLYTTKVIAGKEWKFATSLHFIEGDGLTFGVMKKIINALIDNGFMPYSWGLFGVGGGLRNALKRDNTSAKYALCAVGSKDKGVVKYGMPGKTTLPGPFKVLRSMEAFEKRETIIGAQETGENAMVLFFDGSNIWEPFGIGQDDDFFTIKKRIHTQFGMYPNSLETAENKNYPASKFILNEREKLLNKYQNHTVAA
jgi:nicotinamide phosphoribosyltransferase